MKFLPCEDFDIVTALKPSDVQERLEREIDPNNTIKLKYIFSHSSFYFKGYCINGNFEIRRNVSGRNSFLPVITGSIFANLNRSRLHVKMNLHRFVVVFSYIWFGGLTLFTILYFFQNIKPFSFTVFIPIGMFLVVYLMMISIFRSESKTKTGKLIRLLNGTIEKPVSDHI